MHVDNFAKSAFPQTNKTICNKKCKIWEGAIRSFALAVFWSLSCVWRKISKEHVLLENVPRRCVSRVLVLWGLSGKMSSGQRNRRRGNGSSFLLCFFPFLVFLDVLIAPEFTLATVVAKVLNLRLKGLFTIFLFLVRSHILSSNGVWYSWFWPEGPINAPNSIFLGFNFVPRDLDSRRHMGPRLTAQGTLTRSAGDLDSQRHGKSDPK